MAIISVVGRKVGADDVAFGIGSYTYTDVNGVQHTIPEVSARNIPLDNAAMISDGIGWHPVVATLANTVNSIGTAVETLYFPPGTYPVAADLTIPSNVALRFEDGGVITIPNGVTLTINGPLEAGQYQIFSCTGTGKVAGLKKACPQWFGAVGDDSTDCTAALNSAEDACQDGGIICFWPGVYRTDGWLVTKSVSLVADAPMTYGSVTGVVIKANGAQDYVLKLQGTFTADASTFLHPYMRNITVDGNNQVINDAAFIAEFCHLARIEGCSFQYAVGHGVRLRTVWEFRMRDFFMVGCGTLDTGAAFLIDGPAPLDYNQICSDVRISGGVWSSNKGRWLQVSSLAGIDTLWFEGNKLELDDLTILNTVDTNVLHIGSASRTMILNNAFATFGANYGKYANLIYMGGSNDDGDNGAAGSPSNVIRGNRAYGQLGSGAINGLYLDASAPTCVEDDNVFVSDGTDTCPNVNVSAYPQLINRTWRNFSTSLFPTNPLPDRELPGMLSIHRVSRGSYARPFIVDANCANNAGTVLELVPGDMGAPPLIFTMLDLSRWVGHSATNLMVKLRVRLDAAGSVTLALNLSAAYAPISVAGITSTAAWTWVTFPIPVSTITAANHLLDGYWLSTEAGTPNLLVDGIEFETSMGDREVTTPAVPASTVAQANANDFPVWVTVTGGTVTVIAIGPTGAAVATGATTGSFLLQPGWDIAITYTVVPTWVWGGI